MNYCVLINRLSELMGDERIQLEKTYKCTEDILNYLLISRDYFHLQCLAAKPV